MNYKIGDKVTIIDCTQYCHALIIGSVGTIIDGNYTRELNNIYDLVGENDRGENVYQTLDQKDFKLINLEIVKLWI